MEEVFDLREFILTIFKKFKLVLILAVILGILGAGYGYLTVDKSLAAETYTATSAAAVNLANTSESSQWTPSNMMTMVDSISTSDFVYVEFIDFLIEKDYSSLLEKFQSPTASDVKTFVKFFSKGNLLFATVTTGDKDTSTKVSGLAIEYLDSALTGYINNISIEPQGKQTTEIVKTPAPSTLKRALKYGVFGAGGGAVASILFIFFFDIFDLRIKSSDDLKKYNIPVLGVVPERKA